MQEEEDELGLGLDAEDIAIDASLADMNLNGGKTPKSANGNVSAGFSIPSFAAEEAGGKSKKQKKQARSGGRWRRWPDVHWTKTVLSCKI